MSIVQIRFRGHGRLTYLHDSVVFQMQMQEYTPEKIIVQTFPER